MTPIMKSIWEQVCVFKRRNPTDPQILLVDAKTFRDLLKEADSWTLMGLINSPVPTIFGCEIYLAHRPRGPIDEHVLLVK